TLYKHMLSILALGKMKGNSTCPNNTNPHLLIFLNNCAQHANKKRTKQFVLLCKSDFKIYVRLKSAHCDQKAHEDHVKFHWLNQCHLHHIAVALLVLAMCL